jgi:hypothetical protein
MYSSLMENIFGRKVSLTNDRMACSLVVFWVSSEIVSKHSPRDRYHRAAMSFSTNGLRACRSCSPRPPGLPIPPARTARRAAQTLAWVRESGAATYRTASYRASLCGRHGTASTTAYPGMAWARRVTSPVEDASRRCEESAQRTPRINRSQLPSACACACARSSRRPWAGGGGGGGGGGGRGGGGGSKLHSSNCKTRGLECVLE